MKQLSIDNIQPEVEKLEDGSTVINRALEDVMHQSMMPYAEYVILDRALPRVEDGLKPVQRRILYAMYDIGITPDKAYKKSVVTVAECLGKYHPHGDRSVYDAMVRLAQPFNMNMTLVDGHGNFGSVDGDPCAAMRYTEARLTPLALELMRDIDKDTVKWSRNFDDTTKEPDMLPSRFPNLLVNGSSGIAVGLATNIPPHNLAEVIDGVVAYIDNKHISLKNMMKIIKGPDFPTGGHVISGEGLYNAYQTGKGKIMLRAKVHIEAQPNDRHAIVFTELPYQVNKAQLLTDILRLRDDKKELLAGISDILDESDSEGMRGVIKIKKDYDPRAILDILFKHTSLEISFNFNMVAIADGKPQLMGLLDIIAYYTNFQREVVFNRTKFQLNEALDRIHIVDGLVIAVTNIDEVIAIIKKSNGVTEAKTNLRNRFNLSDRQAQAILDIRLARLTKLEVDKLLQEKAELESLIVKLRKIISDKNALMDVIKEEITTIKRSYKQSRKSEIVDQINDITVTNESDAKPIEKMVVGVSCDGTVKCMPAKNFSMSSKDATDRTSMSDLHVNLLDCVTTNRVMFISNLGNCFVTMVSKLPETKYRDAGINLKTIFEGAEENEKAVKIFKLPEENVPDGEIIFITRMGNIKRMLWADLNVNKQTGFSGFKGKDDDYVINVETVKEDTTILYVSNSGMCINFNVSEVPIQGRNAGGVKGMSLSDDDFVVFGGQVSNEGEIVLVTDKCFVKRVICADLPIITRYRKGVKMITLDKTNGSCVMFADYVTVPFDIALIDVASTTILNTEDVKIENRTTKGKLPKSKKKAIQLTNVVHYITSLD